MHSHLTACLPAALVAIMPTALLAGCPEGESQVAARHLAAEKSRLFRRLAMVAELPPPPKVPESDISDNEIDRFLAADWAARGLTPPPLCDDGTFARRVYLDLVGMPTDEAQLARFLAEAAGGDEPARQAARARLVDRLLSDEVGYAEHWISYWNDMLRNDEQTRSREPITTWLYHALRDNLPYDTFVASLLNPQGPGAPTGFVKGIDKWAVTEASQSPPVQAAQNVGQVFLGTALKCASCHDHFLNDEWKLETFYGFASFFSDKNLQITRCARPRDKYAPPVFIFPELGEVPPDASLDERLEAVSRMVTSPRNPRFARSFVNRLWHRFTGRGFIEPIDDFRTDTPAHHPELLDWLAYDFMHHDFDVKHTMKKMLMSRTCQSAIHEQSDVTGPRKRTEAHAAADPADGPRFLGPRIRRLTAEQLLDTLSVVTGDSPGYDGMAGKDVPVVDGRVRAWRQKGPDPLAVALGRAVVRDEVMTARAEAASVLQSLEMLNGGVLSARIASGAKKLLASPLAKASPDEALDVLYLRAIGRKPTAAEREVMLPALGTQAEGTEARQAGWEDVLWCLFVSPEYQYIH